MTGYQERHTGIDGFNSIDTSPGQRKIHLCFALDNDNEGLILDLNNVYYIPNSFCNLVSLVCPNNNDIYHDNENEALYYCKTWRVLAQAKCWKNSYLLRPLNLSDAVAYLLCINDDVYQGPMICQMSTNAKLLLTIRHKRLGYLSLPSLQKHLQSLQIPYLDDA